MQELTARRRMPRVSQRVECVDGTTWWVRARDIASALIGARDTARVVSSLLQKRDLRAVWEIDPIAAPPRAQGTTLAFLRVRMHQAKGGLPVSAWDAPAGPLAAVLRLPAATTARQLWELGGFWAFWDGINPKLARAVVNHAVTFYIFDLVCAVAYGLLTVFGVKDRRQLWRGNIHTSTQGLRQLPSHASVRSTMAFHV